MIAYESIYGLESEYISFFAHKLADVDISLNPNTFNFWISESEYIKKKTGIRIHFFFKIEGICDLVRIHMNPFMV